MLEVTFPSSETFWIIDEQISGDHCLAWGSQRKFGGGTGNQLIQIHKVP
jgi:hypothetical protein